MTKNNGEEAQNPTAQVTAVINQTVPVGSVISYVGNVGALPPGWMICNGATFNQNQYPALYAALGKDTLPNLSGYFLRGLDPSGKVDPDGAGRKVLSLQGDTFGQHSHDVQTPPLYGQNNPTGGDWFLGGMPADNYSTQTSTTAGGAETRPKNAAVLYLIFAGLPQQRNVA